MRDLNLEHIWGLSKKPPQEIHLKEVFSWSWRGSNPRPNKEPIGFLHAYLSLVFELGQVERDQPKPYPQNFRAETGEHPALAHLF